MAHNVIWRDCSKTRTNGSKKSTTYDVSLSVVDRKSKDKKEVIGKVLNVYFRNKGLSIAKSYKYLIISSIAANRIYFMFLPDDAKFSKQGRTLSYTNKTDKNPSLTAVFPLYEKEIALAVGWEGEYEILFDGEQKYFYIENLR